MRNSTGSARATILRPMSREYSTSSDRQYEGGKNHVSLNSARGIIQIFSQQFKLASIYLYYSSRRFTAVSLPFALILFSVRIFSSLSRSMIPTHLYYAPFEGHRSRRLACKAKQPCNKDRVTSFYHNICAPGHSELFTLVRWHCVPLFLSFSLYERVYPMTCALR